MKSKDYYIRLEQYKIIHKRERYGMANSNHVYFIVPYVNFKVNSILDYGCGRSNLVYDVARELDCQKTYKYDPAIEKYSEMPIDKVDLLLCTDILEHIPEIDIDEFLMDLKEISSKCFFIIALSKANLILPNGSNAHTTIKKREWWADKILSVFNTIDITRDIPGILNLKTWRKNEKNN